MVLSRVSSCHVPWPGVITKDEPPRRAIPAWNDARVRSDGLKNTKPRILHLLAAEIGQTEEAPHAEIFARASLS